VDVCSGHGFYCWNSDKTFKLSLFISHGNCDVPLIWSVNVDCMLPWCRNVVHHSVQRVSTTTRVCRTARRTSTPDVALSASLVTSPWQAAVWRPCTASTIQSTLCARTVSASLTRARSRNRTASHIVTSVLWDCSADVFHRRLFSLLCYMPKSIMSCTQATLSRLDYDKVQYRVRHKSICYTVVDICTMLSEFCRAHV